MARNRVIVLLARHEHGDHTMRSAAYDALSEYPLADCATVYDQFGRVVSLDRDMKEIDPYRDTVIVGTIRRDTDLAVHVAAALAGM